ncbi:MAG TPA: hypothetical protein VJ722_10950, partial [Rhodanobacteraceae bacterium]|nr:hypothetical protein [Rhodanobacteraceae bacterium]
MRLHRFHGGLKLQGRYGAAPSPIQDCALPPRLYVPMLTRDALAYPVVAAGDHVLRGQCVGEPREGVGARVHASTSGTVVAIETCDVASAYVERATCVALEPDGE